MSQAFTKKVMNFLSTKLGLALEKIAAILEEWSRHLIRCQDCGQSTYYGKPCKYPMK